MQNSSNKADLLLKGDLRHQNSHNQAQSTKQKAVRTFLSFNNKLDGRLTNKNTERPATKLVLTLLH